MIIRVYNQTDHLYEHYVRAAGPSAAAAPLASQSASMPGRGYATVSSMHHRSALDGEVDMKGVKGNGEPVPTTLEAAAEQVMI